MSKTDSDLRLLGAALYLCEGTKLRVDNRGWKHHDIEFTNTDPRMLRVFITFVRKILKVEEKRMRFQLFIYPDHSEKKLVDFWCRTLSIFE